MLFLFCFFFKVSRCVLGSEGLKAAFKAQLPFCCVHAFAHLGGLCEMGITDRVDGLLK